MGLLTFINFFQKKVCLGTLSKQSSSSLSSDLQKAHVKTPPLLYNAYWGEKKKRQQKLKKAAEKAWNSVSKLNSLMKTMSSCLPAARVWGLPHGHAGDTAVRLCGAHAALPPPITYCSPSTVLPLPTNGISSLSVFPRTRWCFSMFMTHCRE